MDSTLQTFTFAGTTQIRTWLEDGIIEFAAKDVCEALGYADSTKAISAHCKGGAIYHPLQTTGGLQGVRFINEADLFRLIMRSTLPAAVTFQDWIMEEVLPSLRATGTYTVAPQQAQLPQNYLEAGYFSVKAGESNDHAFTQTRVTAKGIEWLRRHLCPTPLTLVAA